jgi:glucose-6-phosphate 1-dehydrogenase
MTFAYRPPACTSSLVIFGGTGDLSSRKLIPALSRLKGCGSLPEDLHVIVTGRRETTKEQMLGGFSRFTTGDPLLEKGFRELVPHLHFLRLDPEHPDSIPAFKTSLAAVEGLGGAPARLFYLALPPDGVTPFIEMLQTHLAKHDIRDCPPRVLVEKPFGHDLPSARRLNELLLGVAREEQILRIDHYLGKEAVQNIMVLRFANILFEPLWNRSFVDHVQISFSETLGVGSRGGYFDRTGILRDVVQNHLLQVLCLIAMEPPSSASAEAIRTEKRKVLNAIRPFSPAEVSRHSVRGQYLANADPGGHTPAYRSEAAVSPDSDTETFAAVRVFIDSWRWAGVPFYLRAGKRLAANKTEVSIHFKPVPLPLFGTNAGPLNPNVLQLRVQPDEGIHLSVMSKIPGMSLQVTPVQMDFSYHESFDVYRPDAYERLLMDALHGDPSLFIRNDEIEAAWKFIDPIVTAWSNDPRLDLDFYPAFSDGPTSADTLIQADQRAWLPLLPAKPHVAS